MSTSEQPDPESTVPEASDEATTADAENGIATNLEPGIDDVDQAGPPRVISGRRWRWAVVLPLLLLLGAAVALVSAFLLLFRPDQRTDAAAQQQAIAAARAGTEAVLSYSSENLDKSLADAKSHLTGEFLDHYSTFTDDVVRPAVTQKGVKTEANVARAAVSEMQPGKAQVLVFVNQVTTSKERPSPALATSTVMVTLVDNGGRWLISEFKPI